MNTNPRCCVVLATLLFALLGASYARGAVVAFPDDGLEAAVRTAINKPTGDILDSDLVGTGFTTLDASSRNIADLTGIDHCTDLTSLNLGMNQITDISLLSGLNKLVMLRLYMNQISNISALSGLTSLTELGLSTNQVTSISALSGLTALGTLQLGANDISDITPLSGLTGLTLLEINDNNVGSVTALSGLTGLRILAVGTNQISDISPLAGLTELWNLEISNNNITDLSALDNMDGLQLFQMFDNGIVDISALAGKTSLTYLGLARNNISDITPLAGLTGLGTLNLEDNQISNLAPLSGLTQLKILNLNHNQITDLQPLASLTSLTDLHLSINQIAELSPLAALSGLTYLELVTNQVVDLAPLVIGDALGAQDQLYLSNNPLSSQALCEQIPELQGRWVQVIYDGHCGNVANCQMFEVFQAQGDAVAATHGEGWGLSTNYADWDTELWPTVPYGDGIPDRWQLRLVADAYCNPQHRLHELVTTTYEANLATLLSEKPEAAFSWTAATVSLSADMRATVCAMFELDPAHYDVFQEPAKGVDEPFSAAGDCDGDGDSNIEEYEYVVSNGGDADAFAMEAAENSPFWPGNPGLPTAGAIGLVLLAAGMAWSASRRS